MFNMGGPEVLIILLVALIVLGPQQLPKAVRSVGNVMSELRRMSSGFQDEIRNALDVPIETKARDDGSKLARRPEDADITETVARNPADADDDDYANEHDYAYDDDSNGSAPGIASQNHTTPNEDAEPAASAAQPGIDGDVDDHWVPSDRASG